MSKKNNTPPIPQDNSIASKRKRIFNIRNLVLLFISLTILYFLLRNVNFNTMNEIFRKTNYPLLSLTIIIYCISNLFKTFRFKVILHVTNSSFKIKLFKLYTIVSFHNFFNQILPARTGELTFIYYLKKIGKIDVSKGVHSLVVARIFDMIIVSAFFVVALPIYIARQPSFAEKSSQYIMLAAIIGLLSLVSLFFVDRLFMLFSRLFHAIARAMRVENKKLIIKIIEKIDFIIAEFKQFDTARNIPKLAFTSILVWIALYSFWYVTIRAFNIPISYIKTILGSTGAILTNLLPINSFGSIGTFEMGWVGGFRWIEAMEYNQAFSTGLANHFIIIFAGGVISLICYGLLKMKDK